MIFNSLTFVLFFVLVRGGYSLLPTWRSRKILLLLASYLFYAAWNPPFVLLIVLSTCVDYVLARQIAQSTVQSRRKLLVVASLAVNLGLLSYFKYSTFVLDSFQQSLAVIGVNWSPPMWNVILPVGISFYTFQTLSYTIDVYRGKLEPKESLLDFAVFVTFFPQLVAGPIVRAVDFLPQLAVPRVCTRAQFGWGLALITIGLFDKVVLGDGVMASVVAATYDRWSMVSGSEALIGTMAFTAQIFFDFSGYSTIAIGVALTFGFALPDNFHFPYGARGFSDFWQRWHISLSSWLRDYLYISLGGNRKGANRTNINLMLTMLLGGLWHGAGFRFVVWGALHGSYLLIERVIDRRMGHLSWYHTTVGRLLGWSLTLSATMLAWVFFRANSFEAAFALIVRMVTWAPGSVDVVNPLTSVIVVGVFGATVGWHYVFRNMRVETLVQAVPVPLRVGILAVMLFAVAMAPGNSAAFIYFQF
ncbi:MAG: alginate O-acetyltransferase complex protein AlgI [Myxococcota bacterium]|jgi:alginate O-acetyltransferase complex protein AlgI